MTITKRQVKGSPLTIAELDGNFTDLDGRVVTLEQVQATARSIERVYQQGNSLFVQYTDTGADGPFTFTVAMTHRGDWTPNTAYAVNDLFNANGNVYIVLLAHTSAATFDPGANAGSASDYYGLFLSMPSLSLPVGGLDGYVLTKDSNTDFDFQWKNAGVPAGGATNQVVAKLSGDDYDTQWASARSLALPSGGSAGAVLAKNTAADHDVDWATPKSNLSELDDVELNTSGAVDGDVLRHNGVTWDAGVPPPPKVVEITDSEFTLSMGSAHRYYRCTNAAGCNVTVPDHTLVPLEIGSEVHFVQRAAGAIVFYSGTGVAINAPTGYDAATDTLGAVVTLKKIATDEWDLFGMLSTVT